MDKENGMYIDGHPLEREELKLARQGKHEESVKLQSEFLRRVEEEVKDHCPCEANCVHHGNCYECVIIHRGHRDHVPMCFFDMVNERLKALSELTEGTFACDK